MTQETYRIPDYYLVALINADYSGLNDVEIKELDEWLTSVAPGNATCPDGEPFFAHTNDINKLGGNCYDAIFIKH